MHIISRKRLKEFTNGHPDAATPLDAWYRIVKAKQYRSPHDLKSDFSSASFLGDGRTVFNIGGNKYRLVVSVRYSGRGTVFVRHILTHEEYDRRSADGTL
jgi:mRNA interferase HigB